MRIDTAFHSLLVGFQGLNQSHNFYLPATRGEVCLLLYNLLKLGPLGDGETGLVTSVVDGDTIHVQVGWEDVCVRLIGIDTPEMGEYFSYQAKDALTNLVGGKAVRLETDVEERDQYGRLLAYVWTTDGQVWEMANETMLLLGLATLYTVPPNVRYIERLQNAQDVAQAQHAGMWGGSSVSPLQILDVNYDAPGNDNFNLNEEYVVFEVLVSGSVVGYAIEDETGHRYDFPDRVFQRGQVFTLHTGVGTDAQTDLYWGATGSAIWNNSGDTVRVLDPVGQIVTSYSY